MAARGLELAELRQLAGQEIAVSDWVDVTQDMIDRFAELTGDHQWIHVNVDRAARESPFKTTIAHGFLTLSLITRMMQSAVEVRGEFQMTVNYGFDKVRFPAPVPAGSRIRGHIAVNSVKDIERGVEIAWGVVVEIEHRDKPAVAAQWLTRVYFE